MSGAINRRSISLLRSNIIKNYTCSRSDWSKKNQISKALHMGKERLSPRSIIRCTNSSFWSLTIFDDPEEKEMCDEESRTTISTSPCTSLLSLSSFGSFLWSSGGSRIQSHTEEGAHRTQTQSHSAMRLQCRTSMSNHLIIPDSQSLTR